MCFHVQKKCGIDHQQSSILIHKTNWYTDVQKAANFGFDIYMDLWGIDCHFPFFPHAEDSVIILCWHYLYNHTHKCSDLSGPAKPVEGLWRFICHSNVFLGTMPEQKGTDKILHGDLQACPSRRCPSGQSPFPKSERRCNVTNLW